MCCLCLQRTKQQLLERSCQGVPIIAFSHHPLNTVASSDTSLEPEIPPLQPSSSRRSAYDSLKARMLSQAVASSTGPTLQQVLLEHDVAAHINGHLHGGFGGRMHKLLTKPPSPSEQQQGQAGKSTPQVKLAHLETSDWKHLRRWRLMAVDAGIVTFADLYYSPTPSGELGPAGSQLHTRALMLLCFGTQGSTIKMHSMIITGASCRG